jgi:hypothetical protein
MAVSHKQKKSCQMQQYEFVAQKEMEAALQQISPETHLIGCDKQILPQFVD